MNEIPVEARLKDTLDLLPNLDPVAQEFIAHFLMELPFIPTPGEREEWIRAAEESAREEPATPSALVLSLKDRIALREISEAYGVRSHVLEPS